MLCYVILYAAYSISIDKNISRHTKFITRLIDINIMFSYFYVLEYKIVIYCFTNLPAMYFPLCDLELRKTYQRYY